MRVYIIGNDGITLCRKAPATVTDGEVAVGSNEELDAAPLSAKRLLALWNALPGVEKRKKVGADVGVRNNDPQEPGLRVPRRGGPADDAALRDAAKEFGLHGRDEGQAPGRPCRAAEGSGDRGQGRPDEAAVVKAAGMAICAQAR